MEVKTLVEKIEAEIQAEKNAVAKEKKAVQTRKNELAKKEAEIDAKAVEIAETEKNLAPKMEEIARIEGKLLREEQIAKEKQEAIALADQGKKDLAKATDTLNLANVKLAELAKREAALSEEKKTYEARIKQELIESFLKR